MTHFETKRLETMLSMLDELMEKKLITGGEYMQVGSSLKILETLNDIKLHLQAYTQRDRN